MMDALRAKIGHVHWAHEHGHLVIYAQSGHHALVFCELVVAAIWGEILSALNYGNVTKGLIIREPWISMILEGWKTWEMRTKATSIRGSIALIRGGSGTVVGVADLVDSLAPLTEADMRTSELMHGIGVDKIPQVVADGWVVPWVLQDAAAIEPVPYTHPSGAVNWVNLSPEVTQLGSAIRGNTMHLRMR